MWRIPVSAAGSSSFVREDGSFEPLGQGLEAPKLQSGCGGVPRRRGFGGGVSRCAGGFQVTAGHVFAAALRALVPFICLAVASTPRASAGATISEEYGVVAKRIIDATRSDNDAYNKLQELCDDIGHRISGSAALDRAIEWAVGKLKADGHENVHTEPVLVPKWTRGAESLEMIAPQHAVIPMLGLGGSIATPADGITANVLVVSDENDLNARGDDARGKIVLFNFPMPTEDERLGAGYDSAVKYRVAGARMAAAHGAVAALVRSVTTRTLQSPHTGGMRYADDVERIPTAAVSVEFAERMARLQARGIPIQVTLKMEARMAPELVPSANVIAELRGRELPDEIVVISGHLDSWDVGQGAHDDGGGCVTVMEALNVLRRLDLRPRRTIRVVLWTNEENGLQGGRTYAKEHTDELAQHVAAIESDSGVFAPIGYGVDVEDVACRAAAIAQLNEVSALLRPVCELTAYEGYGGADIGPMKPAGVPLIGQDSDMTHYFDIHHTHADTVDKVKPGELTDNVAVMAVTAYILADWSQRFATPAEQ